VRADRELGPAEVRGRLFDALAPVRGLVQAFDARLSVRFVVEWPTLRVQVVVPPRDGATAQRLALFAAETLPDRGAALRAAVEDMVGGILATLPEATAEKATVATLAAQECGGGLFLMADPSDETAILALATPGRSLGEGIYIGALADAPETAH
jgi:hypothetical protein